MSNTLSKLFIFAAGAAIGSVVTWKVVKTKYDQLIQEEIDSVKEAFSRDEEEMVENAKNYVDILNDQGYSTETTEEKGGVDSVERPYVISPDEFAEFDDYETISLTYFADEVLTDEDYNPIEDVDNVVGEESLDHFGDYEDDSVFVRNDRLKTDYEILLDTRRFEDVMNPED